MTALSELAGKVAAGQKPGWRPLELADLGVGTVLAFDQSLRATGWCVLQSTPLGAAVRWAGSITTPSGGPKGWGPTLDDATTVSLEMRTVFQQVGYSLQDVIPTVVHEAPPSGAGKSGALMRPESSALTALGVRLATHDKGWPLAMLSNQPAKSLLTGRRQPAATKAQVAAAIRALPWLANIQLLTNQGKCDAAAVGLLWLAKHAPRKD